MYITEMADWFISGYTTYFSPPNNRIQTKRKFPRYPFNLGQLLVFTRLESPFAFSDESDLYQSFCKDKVLKLIVC